MKYFYSEDRRFEASQGVTILSLPVAFISRLRLMLRQDNNVPVDQ